MALTLSKANVELLRRILDDVLTGPEFNTQTSVSAFQLAEHLWRQASIGVPDFDRIKYSALSLVNSSFTPARLKANHVDQSEIRRKHA
jgi:hypothetical protein